MYLSSVTRYPCISKDGFHKCTWGTPETLSCMYQEVTQKIMSNNNKEILASVWLQFPAETTIEHDDKIITPTGKTGSVISVNHIKNHVEVEQCVEVYLGSLILGDVL